jgi:hypothetical protein
MRIFFKTNKSVVFQLLCVQEICGILQYEQNESKANSSVIGPVVMVDAASCLGKGRIGGEVEEFQPLDRPVWPQPPAPLTPFQHKPDQT